jgi:polyhydroxyalkanoate synthesis regulator phasin
MTRKADFNAEEWSTIVEGPLYAGMWVISADRGGALRESLAMGRVYQAARERHDASELLDELVKSPPSINAEEARAARGDLPQVAAQKLRESMRIVEAKATPAEADAYKTFVMTVAQAVASAHKEGGFLGIGGKQVSDAENQALDEISAALGAPPAS